VIIAADRKGSRLLIAVYGPGKRPQDAAAAIAPRRDAGAGRGLRHDQLQRGARDGDPPAGQWTDGTPAMLRDAMLGAIEGWAPRRARTGRGRRPRLGLRDPVRLPRAGPAVAPSRVTLAGDAAHAMAPTLLAWAPTSRCATQRACSTSSPTAAAARRPSSRPIGAYEQGMRDYVYPFMRMTMEHDRQFGGGALEDR